MTRFGYAAAAAVVLGLVFAPRHAAAQSLGARIAAAGDAPVTFEYTPRAGVCGDGDQLVRLGDGSYMRNSPANPMVECTPGPVQVRLTTRDGVAERAQLWVGPVRDRNARDLGAVPAAEAAAWLLGAAEHAGRRGADDLIMAAVLADSTTPWPALLRIARADLANGRHGGGGAAFWLSRFAIGAVNGRGANSLLEPRRHAESDDEKMKNQAVFVLSQRPKDESIPGLLHVAKTNGDPAVRASAIFWLGQTGDARALDYFEQVLRDARP